MYHIISGEKVRISIFMEWKSNFKSIHQFKIQEIRENLYLFNGLAFHNSHWKSCAIPQN